MRKCINKAKAKAKTKTKTKIIYIIVGVLTSTLYQIVDSDTVEHVKSYVSDIFEGGNKLQESIKVQIKNCIKEAFDEYYHEMDNKQGSKDNVLIQRKSACCSRK